MAKFIADQIVTVVRPLDVIIKPGTMVEHVRHGDHHSVYWASVESQLMEEELVAAQGMPREIYPNRPATERRTLTISPAAHNGHVLSLLEGNPRLYRVRFSVSVLFPAELAF